ncbi:MAG: FixH family protein [Pontibacterium sp.]
MQNPSTQTEQEVIAPGYKQPWLWFVLAPLIAVFFYGTFFLYMAVTTSDGVVKDDYYKVARGVEIDATKAQIAKDLGLSASLTIDNLTGDIALALAGLEQNRPDYLTLELIHPAHKRYDQRIALQYQAQTEQYRGTLQTSIAGKRYATIAPESLDWRLRTELFASVPSTDGVPDYSALDVNTPPIKAEFVVTE